MSHVQGFCFYSRRELEGIKMSGQELEHIQKCQLKLVANWEPSCLRRVCVGANNPLKKEVAASLQMVFSQLCLSRDPTYLFSPSFVYAEIQTFLQHYSSDLVFGDTFFKETQSILMFLQGHLKFRFFGFSSWNKTVF